jgi:hypothetical protein
MELFSKDTQQPPMVSQPIPPAPSGTQNTGLTWDGNEDIPAETRPESLTKRLLPISLHFWIQ